MARLGSVNSRKDGRGYTAKLKHFRNKKGELVTEKLREVLGLNEDEEITFFLESPQGYFEGLVDANIMGEGDAKKALEQTPEFNKLFITGVVKGKAQ